MQLSENQLRNARSWLAQKLIRLLGKRARVLFKPDNPLDYLTTASECEWYVFARTNRVKLFISVTDEFWEEDRAFCQTFGHVAKKLQSGQIRNVWPMKETDLLCLRMDKQWVELSFTANEWRLSTPASMESWDHWLIAGGTILPSQNIS